MARRNPQPPAPPISSAPWRGVALAAGALLLLALVLLLAAAGPAPAPQAALPPPLPTARVFGPTPLPYQPPPPAATPANTQAASAPTESPGTITQAIVVFDAPGGRVLGAIEPGRAYRLVREAMVSGTRWFQLDVTGSGLVWVSKQP